MNKLVLALVVLATAGVLQFPLAFAALPAGCTGNPHDHDSGPTGNPHDPFSHEIGNPHDSFGPGFRHHDTPANPGDICPGSSPS